jgi:hypothetical protein
MKLFNSMLCGLTLALAGASFASATTVTSGPITFNFGSDWCTSSTTGMAHADCSSITITTPAPGAIDFSSLNAATRGNSTADLTLNFSLTSTSAIDAVGLTFSTVYLGEQVNSVTETVYSGNTVVGYADVIAGVGLPTVLSDNIALSGSYTSLTIVKDINLSGFAATDFGSTSFIGQTYSTTSTPEPVSMSLIGGGLALMGLVRMRKSKR